MRIPAIRDVLDAIPVLISITDKKGCYLFLNRQFLLRTKVSLNGLLGRRIGTCFGPDYAQRHLRANRELFSNEKSVCIFKEVVAYRSFRHPLVFQTRKQLFRSYGEKADTVLTVSFDISKQQRAENQLRYLATHDNLTGLANRLQFESILHRLTESKQGFALHLLDLDDFKQVNDIHGHRMGDLLLKEVANRLRFFEKKAVLIARPGGDEFLLIQKGNPGVEEAYFFAGLILKLFHSPFLIEGKCFHVSVSLGVSVFPLTAEKPEELVVQADRAMYLAKQSKGSKACVYKKENVVLPEKVTERLQKIYCLNFYRPDYPL